VDFEWDEGKAASNYKKHGIRFEYAVLVFDDVTRYDRADPDSSDDEVRWLTIGLVEGDELAVISTERGEMTRLISARKASADERKQYWENRLLHF
jgi:uncharacterized DUF497 family protein